MSRRWDTLAGVPRLIFFYILVAVIVAAIYGFVAIGHSFPALGVALLTGAINGLIMRTWTRRRTPRVAGAIVLFVGLTLSHAFAGVPDTGPHRLAYDAQYFAVFLIAMLIVRGLIRRWQPPAPPTAAWPAEPKDPPL